MTEDGNRLPVIQADRGDDGASCSPTIYVSNEEAALLAEMRDLRARSIELRKKMRDVDPERRSYLESKVDQLRSTWRDLSQRRERAFIRKMIMLGHLPPDHPIEP